MRFLLAVLCLLILPGSAVALWRTMLKLVAAPGVGAPIEAGFALGLAATILLLGRWRWFRTLLHETAHTLVAWAFFRRVLGFRVTMRKGGSVTFERGFGGAFGDLLITLAPYYLPTLCLPFLVWALFAPEHLLIWARSGFGFALAFHLWGNLLDLRNNWGGGAFRAPGSSRPTRSDISQAGRITSVLTVTLLLVAEIGLMAAILLHGGKGAVDWARCAWRADIAAWTSCIHELLRMIGPWSTHPRIPHP
jgi:hypothetical protein